MPSPGRLLPPRRLPPRRIDCRNIAQFRRRASGSNLSGSERRAYGRSCGAAWLFSSSWLPPSEPTFDRPDLFGLQIVGRHNKYTISIARGRMDHLQQAPAARPADDDARVTATGHALQYVIQRLQYLIDL